MLITFFCCFHSFAQFQKKKKIKITSQSHINNKIWRYLSGQCWVTGRNRRFRTCYYRLNNTEDFFIETQLVYFSYKYVLFSWWFQFQFLLLQLLSVILWMKTNSVLHSYQLTSKKTSVLHRYSVTKVTNYQTKKQKNRTSLPNGPRF